MWKIGLNNHIASARQRGRMVGQCGTDEREGRGGIDRGARHPPFAQGGADPDGVIGAGRERDAYALVNGPHEGMAAMQHGMLTKDHQIPRSRTFNQSGRHLDLPLN